MTARGLDATLLGAEPGDGAAWSRLRWHACRRGMKELDVLFERFLEHDWADAGAAERRTFLALLELPDPELAALCLGRAPAPDAETAALIARLTDGRRVRHAR